MLADENGPIAWCDYRGAADRRFRYLADGDVPLPESGRSLRAWLVGTTVLGKLLPAWPAQAELFAVIDSVGPGGQTAWVRRGANDGVTVGDCWWLRVGSQPAARFDVMLVEPAMSFCRVRPLVAHAPVQPGDRVALWPTPGLRRDGAAHSRVTYIEGAGDALRIWVPWPRGVPVPEEPHLEFFRGGRYVGHAIADRRDDRYWYARPIHGAAAGEIAVGDEVHIRTRADIEARRFVARVFETGPEGAVVTAGEEDGLTAGTEGWLYRGGVVVMPVRVRRVQRDYALLEAAPTATEPLAFQVLDEIRFAPGAAAVLPMRQVLGTIETVVDETLFLARSAGGGPLPLLTPLAVCSSGRTLAVAVVVDGNDESAIGFLPAAALSGIVSPGATLELAP
jgi:hypothetical protein